MQREEVASIVRSDREVEQPLRGVVVCMPRAQRLAATWQDDAIDARKPVCIGGKPQVRRARDRGGGMPHLVLFDMNSVIFSPYLAAMHRSLISVTLVGGEPGPSWDSDQLETTTGGTHSRMTELRHHLIMSVYSVCFIPEQRARATGGIGGKKGKAPKMAKWQSGKMQSAESPRHLARASGSIVWNEKQAAGALPSLNLDRREVALDRDGSGACGLVAPQSRNGSKIVLTHY
jgi:hypothetical protein